MTPTTVAVGGSTPSSMDFPSPTESHAEPVPFERKDSPVQPRKARPRGKARLWILLAAVAVVLVVAYVAVPRLYLERTDDAYVQADTVQIVPKVAGYVTALHVGDNSRFKSGDLLIEIDPRDFQVAVRSAEANLLSAKAAKSNILVQLTQQDHVIAAAQATLDSDRPQLEFAKQQLDRYTDLANRGSGTVQSEQQATSEFGQKKATVDHDVAALAAAQTQADVLRSQIQQADASIAFQEAALSQAQLNLSYTKIYANADGTVANRSVQVGNFVQPGQTLFSAVPNEAYVIANFKETQLERMEVGQHVRIHLDAFPKRKLYGHVDSFQRGTGSNFALLPPENATGNFVKVVQRVPVKIVVDGPADTQRLISPGMSVEPTVTIEPPPAWLRPFLSLFFDPPD
jgi:membrane fusion protein, multidrug efflux system